MKVTLDTNCIIDLESSSGSGITQHLRLLLDLHESGAVNLQIPGIAASERIRAGGYLPNFSAFTARIQKLSHRPIDVIKPIGHWGVTYWGEGLWADELMMNLEENIHNVLFPAHHYNWAPCASENGIDPAAVTPDDNPVWRKWRNRLCDCSMLWCHIYYNGDLFVTNDSNFLLSKRSALEALGAKFIRHPEETPALVTSTVH